MATLIQDLRYGLRMLAKNPGFTAVAVLTLALGIGANTAIFTLINAILLRRLPVREPHQLVILSALSRNGTRGSFSHTDYELIRDDNRVFSGVLASCPWRVDMVRGTHKARVQADIVSGNYFTVIGVQPLLGHSFSSDDDRSGASAVAVISYAFWQREFAMDPSVVGQTLILGSAPFQIVGVVPQGFGGEYVDSSPDLWVPLSTQPLLNDGRSFLNTRNTSWLELIARLRPGVNVGQARASMAGLLTGIQAEMHIDAHNDYLSAIGLDPGGGGFSQLRQQFSGTLRVLMMAVGFVLLIACANVTTLLLARASIRRREFAIRLTIGAGKARLLQQLFTESTVLALIAGGVGLLVGTVTARLLTAMINTGEIAVSLDGKVLAFTTTISLLTSLIFGIVPSLQAASADPSPVLKADTGTLAGGVGRGRLFRALVAVQVAISATLLVGAGLLVRTLQNLRSIDPGFSREGVIQLQIDPDAAGYKKPQMNRLAIALVERIGAAPGVQSISTSAFGFGEGSGPGRMCCVVVKGYTPRLDEDRLARVQQVSPGYFATLGIRLLTGRDFTAADGPRAPEVALINETMARHYFGGQNPVGRWFGWSPNNDHQIEIVGIVKDAKYDNVREQTPPMVYLSFLQRPIYPVPNFLQVRIRPARSSAASSAIDDIRAAIRSVDPNLPIGRAETLEAEIDRTLHQEILVVRLSTLFGLLGLTLAAVGLYGLLSYAVTWRTREIGVRVALGARARNIVTMILREALLLVVSGIALAIPLTIVVTRFISSQLYGVSTVDPIAIAGAVILLSSAAVIAAYIPARRATKVDPMVALRYE